jgi:hypothetical protein
MKMKQEDRGRHYDGVILDDLVVGEKKISREEIEDAFRNVFHTPSPWLTKYKKELHSQIDQSNAMFEKVRRIMKKNIEKKAEKKSGLPEKVFVRIEGSFFSAGRTADVFFPSDRSHEEITIGEYKLVRTFRAKAVIQIVEE